MERIDSGDCELELQTQGALFWFNPAPMGRHNLLIINALALPFLETVLSKIEHLKAGGAKIK